MSDNLGSSVDSGKEGLSSAANGAKTAVNVAKKGGRAGKALKKGAKAAAKAALAGAKKAAAGILGKYIAIPLAAIVLIVALVGGLSNVQMATTFFLSMKGVKKVNRPKEEDIQANNFSQGQSQEMTEKLVAILFEAKQTSMKKTKDAIWEEFDSIKPNDVGVYSMDRDKTEESFNVPDSIANIDSLNSYGDLDPENESSESERINGEAIMAHAKTYLKKGIKYDLKNPRGKKTLVCSTYVGRVMGHFKVKDFPASFVPNDVKSIQKLSGFKEIYRYNPDKHKKKASDNKALKKAYANMIPGDIVYVAPLTQTRVRESVSNKYGKFVNAPDHVGIYIGNNQMIDCSSFYMPENGIGICPLTPNYDRQGMYSRGKAIYAVYRVKNINMSDKEEKAANKAAEKRWGKSVTSSVGSGTAEMKELVEYAKKRANEHYPYSESAWCDGKNKWGGKIQCHAFTAKIYQDMGYDEVFKRIRYGVPKGGGSFYKNWNNSNHLKKYLIAHDDNGVPESKLQPGDIVFASRSHHSAIYIGDHKVAQSGRPHTRIANYKRNSSPFTYAYRIAGGEGAGDGKDSESLEKIKKILENGITINGNKVEKKEAKNAIYVWEALKGKGFTDEGAAGVMGNLMQEHSFHTSDVKGGLGICQWIGGRRTKLMQRKNYTSIKTQTAFLLEELQSLEKLNKLLKKTKSIKNATQQFEIQFERAGIPVMSKRIAYAKAWYNALTGLDSGSIIEEHQTIGITQGDMDIIAAYSVSLGNLMLSKEATLEELEKIMKKVKKVFKDPEVPPMKKYKKINKILKSADLSEDERYFIEHNGRIYAFMSAFNNMVHNGSKVIGATAEKKVEAKNEYINTKEWNKKLQKEFEQKYKDTVTLDKSIDETDFVQEGDTDLIPFRDINGRRIQVHTFGTDKYNAGSPDLEKDFEQQLDRWLREKEEANFYEYEFETNEASDATDKRVHTYTAPYTVTNENGEEEVIKEEALYGYLVPVIREKSIEEIMNDVFGVDPNDKYVNTSPGKKYEEEWEKYRGGKIKELSKTTKRWTTNLTAVKNLSKATTEVLYNGELPDATVVDDTDGLTDFAVGSGKFICPLRVRYSCNNEGMPGNHTGSHADHDHAGLDMACAAGNSIYATANGVVEVAGWYGGYGYCVKINHGDGITSLYGHMQSTPNVNKGQGVKKGALIGKVGNTGHSTGAHLHFETRKNGGIILPWNLVIGLNHAIGWNNPV